MTKGDAIKKALHWIDMVSVNGQEILPDFIADIKSNMANIINNSIHFACGLSPLRKEIEMARYSPSNLISNGFETKIFGDGESYVVYSPLAKSYSMEVSGNCDVIVEKGENVEWIPNTSQTFTSHKGIITSPPYGLKISVSSRYPFFVKNVGIYESVYPTKEDVPEYAQWAELKMPEDFLRVIKIQHKNPEGEAEDFSEYKQQGDHGRKKLLIPFGVNGEFVVDYFAKPVFVLPEAADDFKLSCNEDVWEILALKLACDSLCGFENKSNIIPKLDAKLENAMKTYKSDASGFDIEPTQIKSRYNYCN